MIPTLIAAAALAALAAPDPPALDEPDLEAAARQLREPWPDARARAVRKLAREGSPAAWALVRRALEDPEPQVADAAQRAMAGVSDPAVLAGWLGREGLRDRDEWVRLRVAQVVGRVGLPVEADDLARVLDPRQVDLARALCASLEDQARARRLGGDARRAVVALEVTLRRGRDPRLRADALAALVAVDPAAAPARLTLALQEADAPLLRAAALRLASGPTAFGLAARHAADADPRVRLAALEVIAAARNRSALELLVLRLEHEPRRHLRGRLTGELRALSGMRYPEDHRPWRRWVAGLAADWRPESGPEQEDQEEPRTESRLGALPLPSDRLCVLVDLSGSLWAERVDGRSRKQLLDQELRSLFERLPRDAAFNLVPYATTPRPWREALVPATPGHVRAALRDFEDCKLTGKGNVWDALGVALADPAVDTVLIVTDGAPTGGRRWDLTLMAELIERERRWSGVAVSSVLVDASEQLRRRWREVAQRTGGLSVAVEFAELGE